MGVKEKLEIVFGAIQRRLDFKDWTGYPQFQSVDGLGRVAVLSSVLSALGSAHFCGLLLLSVLRWFPQNNDTSATDDVGTATTFSILARVLSPERLVLLWQWCAYMTAVTTFHLLEFFVTAVWNPTEATADSFLVNHSLAYTVAFIASATEFGLRYLFCPQWNWCGLSWIGLVLVVVSQLIRSTAMATAGESFNHIIQTRRKQNHVLITHGIYSIFRHPSYVGFFYWCVSVQLLLGNVVNAVGFALASWSFFNRRIPYEEESLVQHFPEEYPPYVARTWMGIPFIRSTVAVAATNNHNNDSIKRD